MLADNPGFAITPPLFREAECDALLAALSDTSIARSRAGARHLMSNPDVAAVAGDARLTDLARQWLGQCALPFRATLFEKSHQTNWLIPWHQDTALPLEAKVDAPGWGGWSAKGGVIYAHAPAPALSRVIALRLHLDASGGDNGPLRVAAGSHLCGVLSDDAVLAYVARHGYRDCLAQRGGVIAMRPLLIHASSKARSDEPRRVLHIEYAESLDMGGGLRLAVA